MKKKTSSINNTIELLDVYKELPQHYIRQVQTYPNYNAIHIDIPFSSIIVGSMGSGKSTIAYNLIHNMACFTRIYLFVKDLTEPIYRFLIDSLEKLGEKAGVTLVHYSDNISDVPLVEDFDPNENNLCIFDDLVLEKSHKVKGQKSGIDKILDIYIRGRRASISCLYISQSYYDIPHLIRKNANYIFIKKINTLNDLKRIVKEYQLSVDYNHLLEYYKASLQDKLSFLLIDLKTNDPKLKYRVGFNGISA